MAGNHMIRLIIGAKDEASKVLDKVNKKADKLDKEKVDIAVTANTKKAETALSRLQTRSRSALSGVGNVLQANLTSVATGAATALAAFGAKAIADFQQTALSAGQLSDALGVTAEEASRLQEVAGDLGIEIGTLESAIGRMNKAAATTPEAFSGIGASIATNADGTTDVTQTFLNTIDALNRIPDATQRAVAAQKIFGRGWMQISELVTQGAEGVAKALALVEAAKIMDDKDVARAREFRDTLDSIKGVAEGVSLTLGGELVDALTDVKTIVEQIKGPFEDLGEPAQRHPRRRQGGERLQGLGGRDRRPDHTGHAGARYRRRRHQGLPRRGGHRGSFRRADPGRSRRARHPGRDERRARRTA